MFPTSRGKRCFWFSSHTHGSQTGNPQVEPQEPAEVWLECFYRNKKPVYDAEARRLRDDAHCASTDAGQE